MPVSELIMDILVSAVQSVLYAFGVSRISGKRMKVFLTVLCAVALCGFEFAARTFDVPDEICDLAEMVILYGVCRAFLKCKRSVSCVTAVIPVYVVQLSFGIVNSVSKLVFSAVPELLTLFLSFILSFVCFLLISKWFSFDANTYEPYVWSVLPSAIFFYFAEADMLNIAYMPQSAEPATDSGDHISLLILQLIGLSALLSTLYIQKITQEGLRTRSKLALMEQEAKAQNNYVMQVRKRYERTNAVRHDIKNHLSVLSGLLKTGDTEQAEKYLEKLDIMTKDLTFEHHTGNTVVDILLADKLDAARSDGIAVSAAISDLTRSGIDDTDLCIIFANAVDNAITACSGALANKHIKIVGERQGSFYRLEFENSCDNKPMPAYGTGLSNIKAVAEHYGGSIETDKSGGVYCLNIILNCSDDHSLH